MGATSSASVKGGTCSLTVTWGDRPAYTSYASRTESGTKTAKCDEDDAMALPQSRFAVEEGGPLPSHLDPDLDWSSAPSGQRRERRLRLPR